MRPVHERRFRLRILETTAKSPARQLARNISPVLDGIISWSAGAPISWYVFANSDQLIGPCALWSADMFSSRAPISWYAWTYTLLDQLTRRHIHSFISWCSAACFLISTLSPPTPWSADVCTHIISWSIHALSILSVDHARPSGQLISPPVIPVQLIRSCELLIAVCAHSCFLISWLSTDYLQSADLRASICPLILCDRLIYTRILFHQLTASRSLHGKQIHEIIYSFLTFLSK
jgi:hypothetical protein